MSDRKEGVPLASLESDGWRSGLAKLSSMAGGWEDVVCLLDLCAQFSLELSYIDGGRMCPFLMIPLSRKLSTR